MSQSLNVLLIEDSEDDALLILRTLRRDSFELTWERIETSAQFEAMLNSHSWDVVISDYRLPNFSAPHALEIFKQSQIDIPFIVVSGTIGESSAVDLMKAGAHDYLMKDNLTRLPEAIRRELREARIRAERKQSALMLAKRDRYLTALVDVQRYLLTATVNQTMYNQILAMLGQIAEVDRMYVFENHRDADGNLLMSQRAEWCAAGISSRLADPLLQNLPYATVAPRWQEILQRGEVINGDIANSPAAERDFLAAQDIRSILVIPMIANGEFFGFIGFDDCRTVKQWESLEVDLLRSAAAALALAKEREQATQALATLNRELEDRVVQRTAALQESEAKLHAILNFAPEVIYVKDMEGRYVFVNRAFLKLFQFMPEQVILKTNQDLFPATIATLFDHNEKAMLLAGQFQQSEEAIQVGDRLRTFISNKFILFNQHGQPYGYCGISTDISDRKDAELQLQYTNEELARATRLKDEFLANMSHELRTPLNAILGMTEVMQEGIFGEITPKQLSALETIERSGNHLLDLINDILDVAKIESGQIELRPSSVSVEVICQSSLKFIQQQALKKQIQLRFQLSPDLPDPPNVVVDERRIRQVLLNLLNNAVKFTPEGGQVTLAVMPSPPRVEGDRQSPYIRIAVSDTGIGIAPENMKRLFQPFVQIDSALNRQYEGTGLGLALVKRLVDLHGGQVGLTSELGVGSCFTVDLPCVINRLAPVPNPTPHLSAIANTPIVVSKSPVILLAEDNEANIHTIGNYLVAKGYQILLAKNGEEAIALAQTQSPDLILMDVQMPVLDGLEATKQIRAMPQCAHIPILALTALAMAGDRDRCLAAGATDYLSKPIRLKELSATIQRFLGS